MKKKSTEVWVGIFVVIGIFLLVLMTLKIERFQVGKRIGYPLHIYFDTAAGLEQNSQVRVAGVRVGEVEKVILEKGKAKVTFRIPPEVTLYKDAKAYLKSEGFLGEKYVEINPGTPTQPKVESGGVIEQGSPAMDVEQFLTKVSDVGEDIKEMIKPVGELIKTIDPKKMERIVHNLDNFSGQLGSLANDSRETIQKAKGAFSSLEDIGEKVKKGEGTLGKLISDEAIYQDAKKTIETAKEAVEKVKGTAEALKNASEKIERGEGTLGKLIQDESLYQEIEGTVKSAKETMDSANKALQSVQQIAEKVEKGEGTLGKLINDDSLVKETEKTMKKVQKAAEGIQEQTPITVLGTIIGLFF
jgi:phospholipid/cholesterol/gamma-HCH transport system substrate-binding protein